MESPRGIRASADLVGAVEGVFEELTGPLQGWKRKLSGKKGETPRKKDVTFVAPDGEEVNNKRQLDKYLKAHPGAAIASDFEWSVPAAEAMTPNGTRRRSARLSLKGFSLTEAIDEEMHSKGPPFKRARKCLALVKDFPAIKTSSEEGLETSANQTLYTKGRENDEANGNHEVIDMDAVKVEASLLQETKDVKVETPNRNVEADNKIANDNSLDEAIKGPQVVKDAIDCNKGPVSVISEDAEKAIEEDNSKIKEVEPQQPQGIHALVQAVPKPQEEEIVMIPEAIVGSLD